MKIDFTTVVAITTIFVIVLFGAFLINDRNTEISEKKLNDLKQQQEELQKENEELQNEVTEIEEEEIREKIEPVNIDCENDLWEGDIKVKVTMVIYSPFGEWEEINEREVAYQLDHGARIINCNRSEEK